MRISVVISTYNKPDWLEKTLWGYSAQSYRDFEIIIADDGSGEVTRARIEFMRAQTGLSIRHIFHEDDGFRKSVILNRAIEEIATDYVLFTDGDCIPRDDFLAVHARYAQPGTYLSGGYFKLPLATSEAITRSEILSGEAFTLPWLIAKRGVDKFRAVKFAFPAWLSNTANLLTTTRATFNGCNTSAWTADIRRANGFDERMRYGGEDRELGERLENAGIRPRQIRYSAHILHLDHARAYQNDETLALNLAIRKQTIEEKSSRTGYGIVRD